MANHKSSLKSIRQTKTRTELNRSRMSRIRSRMRLVEEAITAGEKATAEANFKTMQSELIRGVQRNLFHLNTAARKLSRTWTRIKAL